MDLDSDPVFQIFGMTYVFPARCQKEPLLDKKCSIELQLSSDSNQATEYTAYALLQRFHRQHKPILFTEQPQVPNTTTSMKFQLAVATVSTSVGLSAFNVEAKKTAPTLERRKVELVDAIKNLNLENKTRKYSGALRNFRDHRRLFKSKTGQFLSNDKENDSLDLGVFDSSAEDMDTMQNDERTMNRRLESVLEEGAALVDYFEAMIAAPVGYNVNSYCDEYGDACNTCGTFPVYDPVTSQPTGAYNLEVDCPGVKDGTEFLQDLSLFCNGEYFCVGCEPLCESCSIDWQNFVVSNQNCVLTEQLKVALEVDDLENTLATLLSALAEVQELYYMIEYYQGLARRPFGAYLDSFCEQYADGCNTCGTFPVTDSLTGESTGAYNLEMDCSFANMTDFDGGFFRNACVGEYFCPGCAPVCESCVVGEANIFVSNKNCVFTEEQKLGLGLDETEKKLVNLIATRDKLVAAISQESAGFTEQQNGSQGEPIVELPEEEDVQEPVVETPPPPVVEPSVDKPMEEEAVPVEPVVEEPVTEESGTKDEGSSNAESKATATMVNSLVSVFVAGASAWWMAS